MSKSLTPRIKLTQESDDELVDPFATNWPLLDKYAGVLSVANGVTPPNSDLYDGCIVMEATSGISWIALSDGLGGFTKSWLTYPFQASAYTTGQVVSSSTAWAKFNLATYDAAVAINSTVAEFVAGQLVIKIPGIYEIKTHIRWAAFNNAASVRGGVIYINDVAYVNQTQHVTENSNNANVTTCTPSFFKAFDVGGKVTWGAFQNTGSNLSCDATVTLQLVSPT